VAVVGWVTEARGVRVRAVAAAKEAVVEMARVAVGDTEQYPPDSCPRS
jgi:hypothetical protein